MVYLVGVCVFFFFKQKTAYEMRISDWSSDVCSSDLLGHERLAGEGGVEIASVTMVDESGVDVGRPGNNVILHEPLSLRQFVAENMGRRGSVGDDRACPRQQAREIVPCHMGHGLSPWDENGRAWWRESGCQYV